MKITASPWEKVIRSDLIDGSMVQTEMCILSVWGGGKPLAISTRYMVVRVRPDPEAPGKMLVDDPWGAGTQVPNSARLAAAVHRAKVAAVTHAWN